MDVIEAAVNMLRRHNLWRRGDESAEMVDATLLGTAIDTACDEIDRLRAELVAKDSELTEARRLLDEAMALMRAHKRALSSAFASTETTLRVQHSIDTFLANVSSATVPAKPELGMPVWREIWTGSGSNNNGDSMRRGSHIFAYETHLKTHGDHVVWLGESPDAHDAAAKICREHNAAMALASQPDPSVIGHLGCHPVPAQPAVPDDVAKDAAPEYAWSLCGEEYHDRLATREAAIAELGGSGGFTGKVVDAYDACGQCDIAEVIVDQVENWLSDSITSDDFIIEVTEEQKDALNLIVWEWFYKNVSPNRWSVTDVQEHSPDDVAAILSATDTEVKK